MESACSFVNKHANFILVSRFIELIKAIIINIGMLIYAEAIKQSLCLKVKLAKCMESNTI